MARKILHLDLDAFFCAVEETFDPTLRGKAFAVGGSPDQRGVVSSCSYPARQFGVRSAMPMGRALKLCPDLIVLPGRHHVYGELSHKVMSHCYDRAKLVEQISIDEAFLDVSDLRPGGEDIARELQATIWREMQLPCSIGVAANKLVAKIANNVGKASVRTGKPPMAITVVPAGQEAAFLAPLPVRELWGIGPKMAEALVDLGIQTIGELASWPADDLARRFGKHGQSLVQRALGIDDRPVSNEQEMKSVSNEVTFSRDVSDEARLRRTLSHLAESVGRRLRRAGIQGSTVRIKLRWEDFTTITRQVTLPESTDQDAVIFHHAQELFTRAWPKGKLVRLLGVGVSGLSQPAQQLGLWQTPSDKGQRLQSALDDVRNRFGRGAIRRASDLDDEPADDIRSD